MPVDESLPTASVEAGSKHQFVKLYEALYQFYRAGLLIFLDYSMTELTKMSMYSLL